MIILAYIAFFIIFMIIVIGLTVYTHVKNVLESEILRRKYYGKEKETSKEAEEIESYEDD